MRGAVKGILPPLCLGLGLKACGRGKTLPGAFKTHTDLPPPELSTARCFRMFQIVGMREAHWGSAGGTEAQYEKEGAGCPRKQAGNASHKPLYELSFPTYRRLPASANLSTQAQGDKFYVRHKEGAVHVSKQQWNNTDTVWGAVTGWALCRPGGSQQVVAGRMQKLLEERWL